MGSKLRVAKHIIPIMLAYRTKGQFWVEPFVGGANLIDKIDGNRIGADINHYVIEALTLIRDNPESIPKNNTEFTEQDYKNLRLPDEMLDARLRQLKGFAGFVYSYGAKWLGGWSRNKTNQRDYVKEGYSNAQKQSTNLQGVHLVCSRYQSLEIPPSSLIYCDPPYQGTTKYTHSFDHDAFWDWCRTMSKLGHIVFISEYEAPDDFEELWSTTIYSSLTKDTGSKVGIEKLFKAP